VAGDVADRVREARARDRLPLVIGGDCTIELGPVAGFADEPTAPGLLYDDHGEVIPQKDRQQHPLHRWTTALPMTRRARPRMSPGRDYDETNNRLHLPS
jgi:hypothetical protein